MYYEMGDEGQPTDPGPHPGRCHVCQGEGRLSEFRSYLMLAGTRLRQWRESRELSAYDVAMAFGIEPGEVQQMERGEFFAAIYAKAPKEHIPDMRKMVMSRLTKEDT